MHYLQLTYECIVMLYISKVNVYKGPGSIIEGNWCKHQRCLVQREICDHTGLQLKLYKDGGSQFFLLYKTDSENYLPYTPLPHCIIM